MRSQRIAIAAVVLGVLMVLMLGAQLTSTDPGRLVQMTNHLNETLRLDAKIRQEMLAARTGTTDDYRDLDLAAEHREKALASLRELASRGAGTPTEHHAVHALVDAVHTDNELLTRFRTHNATLHSAIHLLPHATRELLDAEGFSDARLQDRVHELTSATLSLEAMHLVVTHVRQGHLLDTLAEDLADAPPSIDAASSRYLTTVRGIRTAHAEMDQIMEAATDRRVEHAAERLSHVLLTDLHVTSRRAERIRHTLYWLAMFLGIAVVLMFYRVHLINESLEAKVTERTEALADAMGTLREARDAAQEASLAKSQFLATMSHEIRTPLNGVIGMAHLLRGTPLNTDQSQFVDTIESSGQALLTVINDILDFSKIEAGSLELEQTTFSLRDTVDQVGAILAPRAHEKGVELPLVVAAATPDALIGDPVRFKQILTNLLHNGIKFTSYGEVGVEVSHAQDGDQLVLDITVHDTGIGIPEDRMHRLFRTFSQVDSSTTRQYGGTGLGLAICKQLVELMGGEIEVTSTEGIGSQFHYTLRVGVDAAPAASELPIDRALIYDPHTRCAKGLQETWRHLGVPTATVASLEHLSIGRGDLLFVRHPVPKDVQPALDAVVQASPSQVVGLDPISARDRRDASDIRHWLHLPAGRAQLVALVQDMHGCAPDKDVSPKEDQALPLDGMRVLVVEDNPVNQLLMRRMLEAEGADFEVVGNGLLALQQLRDDRYDAVLMDCQMPVMDGFEATHRIRDGQTPDATIPIIALTANAMKGDRERCLDAGMDDYLSKPIHPADLRRALAEARTTSESKA